MNYNCVMPDLAFEFMVSDNSLLNSYSTVPYWPWRVGPLSISIVNMVS